MQANSAERVLVCGAGPVGLTAAITLRSHGVDVRVIDRNEGPTDLSKAVSMWARTLEVIDGMVDCDAFVKTGIQILGARIRRPTGPIGDVDLSTLPSRFGIGVFIPQANTERILLARLAELGVDVERQTELVSFDDRGDHVEATIRSPDGTESTMQTPWLFGCDGSHSTVRHALGLDFSGGEDPDRFVLGDVHVDGDLLPNHVNTFLGDAAACVFLPIMEDRYRMVANTPNADADAGDPTLEELQQVADARTGMKLRLHDPVWLAAFRIRDRVLERYRSGRCLLAGDAAHVHSPVGGQGMNTGMQDAVNLGWKVAFHMRGIGSDALIESYSEERAAVGKKLVDSTTRITNVMTSENHLLRMARDSIMRVALRTKKMQDFVSKGIAMISINYRNVGIRGSDAIPRRHGAVQAGDRLPLIEMTSMDGSSSALDGQLDPTKFALLVIQSNETPDFPAAVEAMLGGTPESVRDVVEVIAITAEPAEFGPDVRVFQDSAGAAREAMGFRGHGAVLVRPDRYTALFMGALDATALREWFESL